MENLLKRVRNNLSLALKPKFFVNKVGLRKSLKKSSILVPYTPMEIDLEPTVRCNLKCTMCQTVTWSRKSPDLSINDFDKIISKMPYLERIKLQGMGEPMLNKYFFEMVELAHSRNIKVYAVTNGSLLSEKTCHNILSSGMSLIYISLDGATKETHENIRIGSSFDQVVKGVKRLVSLRGSRKSPSIEIWSVGQKSNIDELPDLINLCIDLNVDKVTFVSNLGDWGKKEWEDTLDSHKLNENNIKSIIRKAVDMASAQGLSFEVYGENKYQRKEGKRCLWPWWSCYITADGFVTPCCVASDPDLINFGNILKTPFKEIWNSKEYQELRQSIKGDNLPDYCKFCYDKI